jgi:tetratricopeptide (TPR) repeat protein
MKPETGNQKMETRKQKLERGTTPRACHSDPAVAGKESLQLVNSGTTEVLLPRLRDQNDSLRQKPNGEGNSLHFLISNFCFLICRFCILLSTFCFLVSVEAAAPGPGSAEALIEAGHWKRARAILEPRVAANPHDAHAVCLLSQTKLAFGDLDGALKLAQQAVGLEDGSSNYHFQLACVYGEMADRASFFAAASLGRKFKSEVDAALGRDPTNLDALEALMQYSFQAPGLMGGDKGKARAIAEKLVQLSSVRGYLAQAELAKEAKDFAKVEECFLKAVQADPKNYEAQTALAAFYTQPSHSKTEEAAKHAREAVQLDPARAKAYRFLARALALEQRWSELEAVLSAAEGNVPDDRVPYFGAGNALLESGVDLKRAEGYLRKYLAQEPEGEEPDAAHAHRLLGLILEKQGRGTEAVSELEIAVQMNPRFKAAKDDLQRVRNGLR